MPLPSDAVVDHVDACADGTVSSFSVFDAEGIAFDGDGDVGVDGDSFSAPPGEEEQYKAKGDGGGVLEKLNDRAHKGDGDGESFSAIVNENCYTDLDYPLMNTDVPIDSFYTKLTAVSATQNF